MEAVYRSIFDEYGHVKLTPFEFMEYEKEWAPKFFDDGYTTAGECGVPDLSKYNISSEPIEMSEVNKQYFELLSHMFKLCHTPVNHDELAGRMKDRMMSAYTMCRATILHLQNTGLRYPEALLFHQMFDLLRTLSRIAYGENPQIGRLEYATPYLVANYCGMREECFMMFCVNHRGKLKRRVELNRGTENGALFDLHTLMSEALRANPAGVIISHNHPGKTLRPSREDLECTVHAIHALSSFCIPLLDHVIVAGQDVVSIRENGYIAESSWMRQHPRSPLLRNWLMPDGETAPPPKKAAAKKNAANKVPSKTKK